MNIFFLHPDPAEAARLHCDKHVGKMLVETAQMLSTALRLNGFDLGYKAAYVNHPMTVWVRSGAANYAWALDLADGLAAEFTHRFARQHKTAGVLEELRHGGNWMARLGEGRATPVPLCMPEPYKVAGDPVASYRNFYRAEKARFARYTNRPIPDFMEGAALP